MVTYTNAKNIELVANSSYVGTWDQPTNSNWSIVDAALGQNTNITLNNSPVTLSAAQYQCYQITFSSTLTGNVAITFPSTFTGPYSILNNCTGSSAFVVTLRTTVSGGQVIGCPFGEVFDVFNDGTNLKFRNFGRVGSFVDYIGSSVPAWNTACSVPPPVELRWNQFLVGYLSGSGDNPGWDHAAGFQGAVAVHAQSGAE